MARRKIRRERPSDPLSVEDRHRNLDQALVEIVSRRCRQARSLLFANTDLSAEQRSDVERFGLGSLPNFCENLEAQLTGGCKRIVMQLLDLESQGVSAASVLNAIMMPREQARLLAYDVLRPAIRQIGKSQRDLSETPARAAWVGLSKTCLAELNEKVDERIRGLERAKVSIRWFLEATRELRRRVQSPLTRDPPPHLVELLIQSGFSKRRAYRKTVQVLEKWDRERFGELDEDKVRHRYDYYRSTHSR